MKSLDTYSPMELGKFLSEAKLEGRKIAGVESPSMIYWSAKREEYNYYDDGKKFILRSKDATVDCPIIFTFTNGEKMTVDFCSASHVLVRLYNLNEKIDEAQLDDTGDGKLTISDIFEDLVGKTIREFKIDTTHDVNDLYKHADYTDGGFDENAEHFIVQFNLIFTDGGWVEFQDDIDYMAFRYER